jgi:2-keto-3-deoxy-L-rhamnonate aldolase RhmA
MLDLPGLTTSFKDKLGAGGIVTGVNLTIPDARLAEFLGGLGFDCVVVDAEHGGLTDSDLELVAMACDLAGCASMLRVSAAGDLLERYVNLGITGIQIPRVQSVDQVSDVVEAVKFAPRGRRVRCGAHRAR